MVENLFETIQSFNTYLGKIEKGSQLIAEKLREDRVPEALSMILDFSEGMSWLTKATELFQLNDVEANIDVTEINEFLVEINGGLEIQDYLSVADIFEYEIAHFFSKVQLIELPVN